MADPSRGRAAELKLFDRHWLPLVVGVRYSLAPTFVSETAFGVYNDREQSSTTSIAAVTVFVFGVFLTRDVEFFKA